MHDVQLNWNIIWYQVFFGQTQYCSMEILYSLGLAWLLHWRRSSWGCCLRLRWRQLIRWRWCWMISIWWSSRRWGSSVIVVHILILVVIAFKLLLLLTMMWVVLMGVQGTTRMISTALDHSPLIYESGRRGEATQIQITKNPKGSGRVWCRR